MVADVDTKNSFGFLTSSAVLVDKIDKVIKLAILTQPQ